MTEKTSNISEDLAQEAKHDGSEANLSRENSITQYSADKSVYEMGRMFEKGLLTIPQYQRRMCGTSTGQAD